ncbi:discoidin domain-containing protein [Verrucomicrobiaceae bacterium 227]
MEFIYWERGGGAQAQLFAAKEIGDKTAVAFAIEDYELMESTYTPDVDSDDDGLIDGWEIKYFGNLDQTAEGDPDADSSPNLQEQTRGTLPDNDDTDDDGALDGVEDNGGVFVSASQIGTNPCVPDSDGDGLLDGVEDNGGTFVNATMTGTNPNMDDTDEDGQKDGFEVSRGTDPTDPESKSAIATVTLIDGLLGGDLTDPEDDGIEGNTIPADGDTPQTAGTNFNWLTISASAEQYFSGFGDATEGSFDVFDNVIGGGAAKLCCGGAPLDITVGFETPVSLTHFTLTSSNDTPARDPLDFQIQGSNDGVNFEVIYDRVSDESFWGATRDQTVRIDLPEASDAYQYIRYAVTRTGGANHAISEIEYFGEVGEIAPPEISSIEFDKATNRVTLTWNSRDNKTYSLFASPDLTDFSSDIDDSIPSQGDFTTYSFVAFDPVLDKRFFRVSENE